MMNLCRFSVCRILPHIRELNASIFSIKRSAFLRNIQPMQACLYCKRYGLYDEEEDGAPLQFNRRGAYLDEENDNRRNFVPQRQHAQDSFDEEYDDNDFQHRPFRSSQREGSYKNTGRFRSGGYPRENVGRYSGPKDGGDRYPGDNAGHYPEDGGYGGDRYPRDNAGHYPGDGGYGGDRYPRGNTGRYPGRGGYGGDRNPRSYQFNRHGRNSFQSSYSNQEFGVGLNDAHFDVQNLQPIEKNFYSEHPNVSARSKEDLKAYLESINVATRGTNVPNPITTFDELNVDNSFMQLIHEGNFSLPTPIQAQGWPIVLSGRDMIGISQTGSGKTLVYALPAMIHIKHQPQSPHDNRCAPNVLVLAPTRELAQQIHEVCFRFRATTGIRSSCIYGGAAKGPQMQRARGSQICIATPGRLIDFLTAGVIDLRSCTYLVLDEADRMLDMGFEPQIRKIIGQIRPDRQTLMWSATWPKEIKSLAEDFLTDYIQVTVGSDQLSANPNIQQNIYIVSEYDKFEQLRILLGTLMEQKTKVLIFCQTKRTVDNLTYKLQKQRLNVMCIHGDVSQAKRDHALSVFRNKPSSILIATDVAARGLDVSDVHNVVNYDFPQNIEDYIHRIGRTARGLNKGNAHSFFTDENIPLARQLVSVLEEAKQTVNPELLELIPSHLLKRVGRKHYGMALPTCAVTWRYSIHTTRNDSVKGKCERTMLPSRPRKSGRP